jgi:endonuclease/exonuclease/phosphatase family metal-dependent hydrolase
VKSFIDRGHEDAHQDVPLEERYTSFDPFDMVLDIILPRGVVVTRAGRCPPERCEALSDHLPVFAEVRGVLGE